MKLFSEIEEEYNNVRQILDEDEENEIQMSDTERVRWEAWAEALTFCMYADGECP